MRDPERPSALKKIIIIAGEASGDLHGSNLVRAIQEISPDVSFRGIGGNRLRSAGVDLIAHSSDMGVVGLTEVFTKLHFLAGIFFKLRSIIRKDRPDLLILIDYPDFNIPLAKIAAKNGVPVFYFISPQVWAWRSSRINDLKKTVAKMAVILPFEPQFYKTRGMEVDFVGHPLLDVVPDYPQAEQETASSIKSPVRRIGIMPGSRLSEIHRILPDMLRAAELLKSRFPNLEFFLPLADTLDPGIIKLIIGKFSIYPRVITEGIYTEIRAADAVMVTSGTATLETALLGTPMVVVYKVSLPTYLVGRIMIHTDYISLVNIIAGKKIVPELIQGDMNPEKIASEISGILENGERSRAIREQLGEVRKKLGSPGAADRAARLAWELISKTPRTYGS